MFGLRLDTFEIGWINLAWGPDMFDHQKHYAAEK
jgi:hypothetical protein